jgi:hypothetical protein
MGAPYCGVGRFIAAGQEMLASPSPAAMEAFLRIMLAPSLRDDGLAAVRSMPSPPTALLLQRFDDAHVDYRFAAARALGALCEGDVRSDLQQMVLDGTHRREALAALVWCHDPHASQFLAAVRADRAVDAQFRAVSQEVKSMF